MTKNTPKINITPVQVRHVANLAHIPVSDEEATQLTKAFADTLTVVDALQMVDVTGIEPTHQVTGLENVWREDVVDEERQFTQEQALANAPRSHQGYFVVGQIINQED
jgi:aspartyl-tRNA(Asn)/glutamyl-tRNA(Gln) amidotransferase subunit C